MFDSWHDYLLAFAVFIFVITVVAEKYFGTNEIPPPRYRLKKSALSFAELSFYRALCAVLPEDYHILMKVRLCDVIEPGFIKNNSEWYAAFNKIKSKHLDFVICNKKTFEYVCVIELDDKSHNKPERLSRDKFINTVFESLNIDFVRFKVSKAYDIEEMLRKLYFLM